VPTHICSMQIHAAFFTKNAEKRDLFLNQWLQFLFMTIALLLSILLDTVYYITKPVNIWDSRKSKINPYLQQLERALQAWFEKTSKILEKINLANIFLQRILSHEIMWGKSSTTKKCAKHAQAQKSVMMMIPWTSSSTSRSTGYCIFIPHTRRLSEKKRTSRLHFFTSWTCFFRCRHFALDPRFQSAEMFLLI